MKKSQNMARNKGERNKDQQKMYLEHQKLSRAAKFQKNFEQVSSNFTYPAKQRLTNTLLSKGNINISLKPPK